MNLVKNPVGSERRAVKAAQKAADFKFAELEKYYNCGAFVCTPLAVVDAALAAYQAAGGRRKLAVIGRGNSTHAICYVECGIERLI